MSKLQSDNTDAVLGGQNPPPINAAVLGGIAGEERIGQKLSDRFGEIHHLFKFETARINNLGESIDRQQKHSYFFTEYLHNEIHLEMIFIPQGQFMMGSEDYYNEQPCHLVDIPAFHISKYPITQSQYRSIMGVNPSFFTGEDRLPVENVSWNDTKKFCHNLSEYTGKNYRLPSESEWEYICRAGTNTAYSFGDMLTAELANFGDGYIYKENLIRSYQRKTTPVGIFPANNFGAYDTHGNIWEWCEDLWHKNYHNAPGDRRIWESGETSSCRVLRGGSWLSDPWFCRSSSRSYLSPESKNNVVGFRVALLLE
jgi:formylglycine-generating enzyme required for sulfatase activity